MKANDLRKLGAEELAAKETELSQELFNLKFQHHTGRLENTARVAAVRKDIAKVKTILRETKG